MADYQPVSCDLYDWLEIAASWQLPVTITDRDGRTWADKIRTIEASDGVEYLLLGALSASAWRTWRPWNSSGKGKKSGSTSPHPAANE